MLTGLDTNRLKLATPVEGTAVAPAPLPGPKGGNDGAALDGLAVGDDGDSVLEPASSTRSGRSCAEWSRASSTSEIATSL